MTKTNTLKVTELRNFKTNYLVGNTVVATREQLKYRLGDSDWWHGIATTEDMKKVSDIESLVFYHYDELTPEGKKMKEDVEAKKAEADEEDDD
jgi:hypothetical protein